jgi:ubiquinone/menaquinone biosynthesis C-methylase UbiE
MTKVGQILSKRINIVSKLKRQPSSIKYWEQRAKQHGRRAVLHLGHTEAEIEAVTCLQKEKIFPALKTRLHGKEALLLDFGCGTGRFTADLAALIQGQAIGVDPIETLIDLAPKDDKSVEYRVIKKDIIPIEDNSIDVVWICLVLGGITDKNTLYKAVNEIKRVLKKDGLLFLVENTSEKKDTEHWKFRSVQEYQTLFKFIQLEHISDYFDLDERISIMAGNKCV